MTAALLSPARTNIISQTTHTLAAKATPQIREQRLVSRLSIAVLCWSSVPTFSLSNNSPLICQSLHLDNSFPLIFFYFRLRRIFGVQTLLLNAYSTIVQSKYIKQQVVSIYSSAFPIFNFIKWQLSEHNRHSYPQLLDCFMHIISDIIKQSKLGRLDSLPPDNDGNGAGSGDALLPWHRCCRHAPAPAPASCSLPFICTTTQPAVTRQGLNKEVHTPSISAWGNLSETVK